jgi:hypothetical protein
MRILKKELWPHKITLEKIDKKHNFFDIELWLKENIGLWKDRWIVIYFHNKTDIYFVDEKDATMFALRWS